MKNVFTIDVEDWYQTQDFHFPPAGWGEYEDRVELGTRKILELLERHQIKATFFVLGYIAEKHPQLIRDIAAAGHEIGSHGYWHQMVGSLTHEEFRKDLKDSKMLLEDIIGKEVNMYRACSWSISPETLWALEMLEEEGFLYDSSVQPFQTPLSGMKGVPLRPFHPVVKGRKLKLLEFPPSVMKLGGVKLPFAGGLYLRLLPYPLIRYALEQVNHHREGLLYVHPWELDEKQPRLKVPPHLHLVHYCNLSTTANKLDKLLKEFEFVPLGELMQGKVFESRELCKVEN